MLVCATKASVLAKLTPDIYEVIHLHTTAQLQYKQHRETEAKAGRGDILEKQKGEWGGGYEVICTDSMLGTHIRAENRAVYFIEQASNW